MAMKQRRDTLANWTSVNPIPFAGQICIETDTHKMKIGNDTDHYLTLPYFQGYSGYSGIGTSGYSGYSGKSGYSGYSGLSTSGYSGYSGKSGYSGAGVPAGSTTQIMFNDAGAFAGDVGLTYNKTTDALTVGGSVYTTGGGAGGVGTNPLATTNYIQSRGLNLVTNGSGLLGNNYNFSAMTFDAIETHGGGGSFSNITQHILLNSDELIPINNTKNYLLTAWGKSGNTDGSQYNASNSQINGIIGYDIDGLMIENTMSDKFAGSTDTYLASDLVAGATTMTLVDATGWYNSTDLNKCQFVWYGYTNSKGYTYPDFTYTRFSANSRIANSKYVNGVWANGGITGNVVTLTGAWTGTTIPAGTAIRNTYNGGTYQYILGAPAVPNTWTKYTGTISGLDTTGSGSTNLFRQGTAYVKILFLGNYNTGATNIIRYSDISLVESGDFASDTSVGIISLANQTLGAGDKYFTGTIKIAGGTPGTDKILRSDSVGLASWVAASAVLGTSGYSGYSGKSGYSGYSGVSGTNGSQGTSGYSGINGTVGTSGYSGYSGSNGSIGTSGYSGIGTSGYSGYSGKSGYSGANGTNGTSGYSGYSGIGTSGYSGYSGTNGTNGTSGYSGKSGKSGGYGGNTQLYGYHRDPYPINSQLMIGQAGHNTTLFSDATEIYLNQFNAASQDITAWIQSLDDSTSAIKGQIRFTNTANTDQWVVFDITGSYSTITNVIDASIIYVFPINPTTNFSIDGFGSGTVTMAVTFARTGDLGTSGYSGTNGSVGTSGYSGANGTSGYSGIGTSGYSGANLSGYSGTVTIGGLAVTPNNVIVHYTPITSLVTDYGIPSSVDLPWSVANSRYEFTDAGGNFYTVTADFTSATFQLNGTTGWTGHWGLLPAASGWVVGNTSTGFYGTGAVDGQFYYRGTGGFALTVSQRSTVGAGLSAVDLTVSKSIIAGSEITVGAGGYAIYGGGAYLFFGPSRAFYILCDGSKLTIGPGETRFWGVSAPYIKIDATSPGTAAAAGAGAIVFDGAHFLGSNGSAWLQLDN